MIKNVYTFFRIILVIILFILLFLESDFARYPFFITVVAYTIFIPYKRFLKAGSLTSFETKLNYFLDEFFVYGSVVFLSTHGFAPFFVVIIYFFKDATIGAIRNFAIKNDVSLNERFGYKLDKVIQYTVVLIAAYYFIGAVSPASCEEHAITFVHLLGCVFLKGYIHVLFIFSAIVSAFTLIIFFILNKDFMKKIQNT